METGNEVDIDVSLAVSMSLVGAVITGVLLWFVCTVCAGPGLAVVSWRLVVVVNGDCWESGRLIDMLLVSRKDVVCTAR